MAWIQVRVHGSAEQVDKIENALLACGALSVTLQDDADQPILEPELGTTPVWEETEVIGLFNADQDANELLKTLAKCYDSAAGNVLPRHKVEILEDKDWVRAWMDDYHPMPFGERLWVCPSWREPPQPEAVNLMLDPGLAFGTGTHPTTALCLAHLDKIVTGDEVVVDFGCGSGVLGIAALLLGAKQMVGVDIDPQALIATKDNADRNNVSPDCYQVYLPEHTPSVKSDILVANILAGPLTELAPIIANLIRPGGQLALSGLLAEQASMITDCYQTWFEMDPPVQQEDWILLSGVRRSE